MIKYTLFVSVFLFLFQSCNLKHESRSNQYFSKKKVMDITSYNGNAVAFFSKAANNSQSIIFIPIQEKDSNKFKNENIFELIKGRCSISIFVGDYMINKLLNSKEKVVLTKKICNVNSDYYAKIWIKYEKYEEATLKRKFKLTSDSCACRDIGESENSHGIMEFKILQIK